MSNFNFIDMTSSSKPIPDLPKSGPIKLGIVGAGKRVKDFILPLAKKSNKLEVAGFFSRSKETREAFSKDQQISSFDTLEELSDNCDAFVVCVSLQAAESVNRAVAEFGKPMLVETPVSDLEMIKECLSRNQIVGSLEQWPYLPLEQFKKKYVEENIKSSPYLVVNDCRSFDYHAIAQIRTYLGRDQKPLYSKSAVLNVSNPESQASTYINNSGDETSFSDSWDLGIVNFERGILQHNFSYMCKSAPYRAVQTLRSYFGNGTIITGKLKSFGDDYDILEFSHLSGKDSVISDVSAIREGEVTLRIEDKATKTFWDNPYKDLKLDDQQTGVMTVLEGFADKILLDQEDSFYSAKDALIDFWIVNVIKSGGNVTQAIPFGNLGI